MLYGDYELYLHPQSTEVQPQSAEGFRKADDLQPCDGRCGFPDLQASGDSDRAIFETRDAALYGDGDSGIMYNDPDLAIEWPMDLIGGEQNLIISEKDTHLMSLKDYLKRV